MDLYNAATALDVAHTALEDILAALGVLDGAMNDAYPWNEQDKDAPMKLFAKNFPVFFSTYSVICRDLRRTTTELKEACDLAYAASFAKQRGADHGAQE